LISLVLLEQLKYSRNPPEISSELDVVSDDQDFDSDAESDVSDMEVSTTDVDARIDLPLNICLSNSSMTFGSLNRDELNTMSEDDPGIDDDLDMSDPLLSVKFSPTIFDLDSSEDEQALEHVNDISDDDETISDDDETRNAGLFFTSSKMFPSFNCMRASSRVSLSLVLFFQVMYGNSLILLLILCIREVTSSHNFILSLDLAIKVSSVELF
jgi:hypothetical protein